MSLEEGHEVFEARGEEDALVWAMVLQVMRSVYCSVWGHTRRYIPVVPSLCSQRTRYSGYNGGEHTEYSQRDAQEDRRGPQPAEASALRA